MKFLNIEYMVDYSNILKEINNYKYVSFDVFDTLIIRDVGKPTDIFRLCYGFIGRYIRVLSEIVARKVSKTGEVTLKDIQKFCPLKLDKEISEEYEYCHANPKMLELYKRLLKEGKKIYAISDMYLDASIIEEILKRAGYEIPVIVSCEYGKNKKSGELFNTFLNKYSVNPKDLIHIGDSRISDYEGAQKAGIKSILIEKHINKLNYTKIQRKNIEFAAFVNHGLNDLINPVEMIGYEIVGPLVLSFCQWVHKKYHKEKFDRLFFLARDMKFIFEIYKDLYKDDNIRYLHVSRKSFLFSREHPDEMINYLKNNQCYGNVAIVDTGWLGNAQVEIEKYSKKISPESDIGGLYLGMKLTSKLIKRSKRSFCCLFPDIYGKFQCELFPPFMETLIGSNDKQVISYKDGNPIFDREESRDKTNLIKDGARKFISDWIRYKKNKEISYKNCRKSFIRIFRYPKDRHINLIGNLHYEDFKDTCIVSYDDEYKYRTNVKKWLSDLSYSGWKGAYFKKSFSCYVPILLLYLFLNSLRNMFIDIKKVRKGNL